jgi:hypothetical protein
MDDDGLLLVGLDAGNPLAFLAALGTLRALAQAWPGRNVRMAWRLAGGWRPVLYIEPGANANGVIEALDHQLQGMREHDVWKLGPDLSVVPAKFKEYASEAAAHAHATGDRTWAEFASAFGCEATEAGNGSIQDTALRTMSGAGHQHFLQFMALIVDRTGPEHLEKTLLRPWRYDDAVEKQTLRWDPADDVRRALRWRDPSGDPQRRRRGGMLGANRLAIEGLPLLPCMPVRGVLQTTGFQSGGAARTFWHWPIWSGPLAVDVVRSLLAHPEIMHEPTSDLLRSMGVAEVFRCRRLTIDKFRSFTPAQPIEPTTAPGQERA